MKNKYIKFSSEKSKYLILGLLVLTMASGAVWLKYYSPYGPNPLRSSADEEPLKHWPYSTSPAVITLLDSSSNYWGKHLALAMKNWEKNEYIKINAVEGLPAKECEQMPELIHFCTVNDPNFFIAFGSYVSWTRTGHIIAGSFILNDYYLNNPDSPYGTSIWRNKLLCSNLGWSMGLDFRYYQDENSTTCMEALWVTERVPNPQGPDEVDLAQVKERYSSHADDTSSSSLSSITAAANLHLKQREYGDLVRSFGESQSVYKLDLGNGYEMTTIVQEKPFDLNTK